MGDISAPPTLLGVLFGIIVLSALCAGWVWFQMWLNKQDPAKPKFETKGCGCHTTKSKCVENKVKAAK